MTKPQKQEKIRTKIWKEVPEEDNPFAAKTCFCSGFDVYGDLLGKVSWIDYILLLFKLDPPSPEESKLLEGLAVALANPGPRDHSVRSAMNAGVGGSTNASALIAALSVGAGSLNGGREIYCSIQAWSRSGLDAEMWLAELKDFQNKEDGTWPKIEHFPGFDPAGVHCSTTVLQTLDYLTDISSSESAVNLLKDVRETVEEQVGYPLAMSGVASAVLFDLGLNAQQAEMMYLLLRLPGAAVHALEQREMGWRRYPFFGDGLVLRPSSSEEGVANDNH